MIRVLPVWISLRFGLGFIHFLYDRWLYNLSDPRVRATIGRDVFCLEPIPGNTPVRIGPHGNAIEWR